MKLLVTGSRKWTDAERLDAALDALHAADPITVLIEGCAAGADRMADLWASKRGVKVWHFPADFAQFGKAAGPRRNSKMLADAEPERVIAFTDDPEGTPHSGTWDMVRKARTWGLDVVIVTHPAVPA